MSIELASISSEASTLKATAEQQQSEVEQAVRAAATSVADLTKTNDTNFEKWTKGREESFRGEFASLKDDITEQLASAKSEYSELIAAKDKYQRLVGAIAADEVSSQFESEARWGRLAGSVFYTVGFLLLAAAAIPLVWLIFDKAHATETTFNWNVIIVRVTLAILAGTAATVAIRLGGRLVNDANAIKRMELELRAIGPFLANLSDETRVDDAFIGLIGKSFGNGYAQTASTGGKEPRDSKDEPAGQVTLLAQISELVKQLQKVNPPPTGGN